MQEHAAYLLSLSGYHEIRHTRFFTCDGNGLCLVDKRDFLVNPWTATDYYATVTTTSCIPWFMIVSAIVIVALVFILWELCHQ